MVAGATGAVLWTIYLIPNVFFGFIFGALSIIKTLLTEAISAWMGGHRADLSGISLLHAIDFSLFSFVFVLSTAADMAAGLAGWGIAGILGGIGGFYSWIGTIIVGALEYAGLFLLAVVFLLTFLDRLHVLIPSCLRWFEDLCMLA